MNTDLWLWPQYTYAVLILISLVATAIMHGQYVKVNIVYRVIGLILGTWVLVEGGFFG